MTREEIAAANAAMRLGAQVLPPAGVWVRRHSAQGGPPGPTVYVCGSGYRTPQADVDFVVEAYISVRTTSDGRDGDVMRTWRFPLDPPGWVEIIHGRFAEPMERWARWA